MKDKNILLNQYDILSAFNEDYYKDLITKNHLGEETVIKVRDTQKFIYPVKYRGKLYAIPAEIVEKDKLPIKITKSSKLAYRSNVYHLVTGFNSFKIKPVKSLTFRQLVDTIADFNHTTKDTDFKNYKIATIMCYLKKGFIRCVSEAAFGKNSVPGILKILLTDVAIFNPRTAPVFEAKLINKLVVLDELTNLERSQRDLMQEALLQVADGSPSYEKGSRGSAKYGTKDEYDISKLSIMILYNIYSYYAEAGQGEKYFDNVFTHAVKDRFLPVYMEGHLDSMQFVEIKKPKELAQRYSEDIKKIIRTLRYYEINLENEDKDFKLNKVYRLSKSGRQDKTFNMILQGFRLYANTEEEYNLMAENFYKMHLKYKEMVQIDFSCDGDNDNDDKKASQKTLM